MYLRRLEIAGFKSFGSRVKLDFKPGISAIVGPNGSGKSNIAEAIRWVLGSQNARDLRARKTEELIYAGADGGKAKSSMAEVILTLEGKPRDTELGISELTISRRLYRSGESEYRIGERIVRVKDLQRILAQVGFGTASYTVIGQGMIDSLIIATPAERKLLFEEASGIRAFELERTDTTRKLMRAREQAEQLRLQIQTLYPEKNQLAEQVKRLERKREIEKKLIEARADWLHREQNRIQSQIDGYESHKKQLMTDRSTITAQLKSTETDIRALAKTDQQANRRHEAIVARLTAIDESRNALSDELAAREAELRVQEEQTIQNDRPSQLKREYATEQAKLEKYHQYLTELTAQNNSLEQQIAGFNAQVVKLNATLTTLRQKLVKNQRNGYLKQALGLARTLYTQLNKDEAQAPDAAQLRIVLHKLIRMVKLASEADMSQLPGEIGRAQQQIARELTKREDVVERQTTVIIKIRSLELDINASEKLLAELTARITKAEALNQPGKQLATLKKNIRALIKKRSELDVEATTLREELSTLSSQRQTDQQLTLARQSETLRARLSTLVLDLSRIDTAINDLHQELRQRAKTATHWKIQPRPAAQAYSPSDISRFEAELELIGELDTSLTEIHDELAERIRAIETQAADLETASDDLQKILQELGKRIRQTFDKNFARLNTAFAKHFKELFGGGTAELRLEPQDDDSYGINIVAKPPSKRVEHLASLSGGEKAMTAIALLAAILTVNPSPFVVLDEVDAPLDDANTLAFTHILRGLARHAQLLVITHNHETMLQADELYGVTANARMSSRVITVDLRTAEALSA
ncbi:AAA family ATPase [bacterium]|nr:AAA family ATPase [bacterium]